MVTKIAAIAACMLVFAGSAFAASENTNTSLRDGGRYVPELNEPATHYSPGKVSSTVSTINDNFQAQGTW
jgi:hypothetical protein